jgi:hypothetical protein
MTIQILTQQKLKELLDYNPNTGEFVWKIPCGQRAPVGAIAGSYNQGYKFIKINGKKYSAHRLAWLYTHGQFPQNQLDHINRIRNDNRIDNLREVTNSENQQNVTPRKDNISGIKGVEFHTATQKWQARIALNGKRIYLGLYNNIEDAIVARKQAEQIHHPFKVN